MDNNQLPLFNRRTIIMGEGYRQLAAFKFKEATQHFEDVLYTGSETDAEASRALQVCEDWELLIRHDNESISKVYQKFRAYDFGSAPGMYQFKNALLEYITGRMLEADLFYLDDGKTVSDLLLELHHYEKAEKAVIREMGKHPGDHRLNYFLAQILWRNNKKGEAKKILAKALLCDPCQVPSARIEYKDLHTLIRNKSAEMAPAFGWVRGILPLVPLPEGIKSCSEAHQKAIESYRLLYLADQAAINHNRSKRLEYRKNYTHKRPIYTRNILRYSRKEIIEL